MYLLSVRRILSTRKLARRSEFRHSFTPSQARRDRTAQFPRQHADLPGSQKNSKRELLDADTDDPFPKKIKKTKTPRETKDLGSLVRNKDFA